MMMTMIRYVRGHWETHGTNKFLSTEGPDIQPGITLPIRKTMCRYIPSSVRLSKGCLAEDQHNQRALWHGAQTWFWSFSSYGHRQSACLSGSCHRRLPHHFVCYLDKRVKHDGIWTFQTICSVNLRPGAELVTYWKCLHIPSAESWSSEDRIQDVRHIKRWMPSGEALRHCASD